MLVGKFLVWGKQMQPQIPSSPSRAAMCGLRLCSPGGLRVGGHLLLAVYPASQSIMGDVWTQDSVEVVCRFAWFFPFFSLSFIPFCLIYRITPRQAHDG